MQKLYSLNKWKRIGEGSSIVLPSTNKRRVRLYVNAPEVCRLYINTEGDEDSMFLSRIEGLDILEFIVEGRARITCDSLINFYMSEGETVHVDIGQDISFTKLVIRKKRNRELEEIVARANANAEKRMRFLLEEQSLRNEALMKRSLEDERLRTEDKTDIGAVDGEEQPQGGAGEPQISSGGSDEGKGD